MNNAKPSPKRGRPRSFDLDEATGKAAHLFWRRGYEGVSVDELTTAMGITTQSFYAAYGSKQKLHRDALDWYAREIIRPVGDALLADGDVIEAVRAALEAAAREFTRDDRPAGCMRSMAGLCASSGNEAVARHGTDLRLETTAFIKARLDRGVADGYLGHVDTAVFAIYLNAAIVGMSVAAQDGAGTAALLAVARTATSAFGAMAGAEGGRPTSPTKPRL